MAGTGKKVGIILEVNSLGRCPPGPALTEAAVDDPKAAAKRTHKSRRQFKAALGFQGTSQVRRLGELLIEGSWVRCYGQRQQGFLHGTRKKVPERKVSFSHPSITIGQKVVNLEENRNHDLRIPYLHFFGNVTCPTKKQLPSSVLRMQYQPPAALDRAGLIKQGEEGRGRMSHLRVPGLLLLTTLQG